MIAVLDTHIVLWWLDGSRRLTRDQTRMLARNDAEHPLGVADISLWEIAALVEVGRVRLALPVDEWLARATAAPRVEVQPVTPAIASEVIALGDSIHRLGLGRRPTGVRVCLLHAVHEEFTVAIERQCPRLRRVRFRLLP